MFAARYRTTVETYKPPKRLSRENLRLLLALTAFAGRYECDLYGDLTVSHKNDKLLITFGTNGPAKATHWEHDTFYVRRPVASDPDVDWLVSFTVRGGKSQSLSIRRLGWHEPMPTFKRGAIK